MKRLLFVLFCIVGVFSSCQKDGEANKYKYDINYQVGETYTQTFYVGNHFLTSYDNSIGVGYSIFSICNSLSFKIKEGEDGFSELRPPQEFYNDVVQRNNDLKNTEHKYYAIADYQFTYDWSGLKDTKRVSEWKLVIGKMEEYVFKDSIYKHLVVVEEL
ncbi:MAG: hypothetical protein MSA48_08090 [Bacteroides sp.]|nr:hypothetical protein [Bacteroides sp.]